jgi:hypothetical protein
MVHVIKRKYREWRLEGHPKLYGSTWYIALTATAVVPIGMIVSLRKETGNGITA